MSIIVKQTTNRYRKQREGRARQGSETKRYKLLKHFF